MIEQLEDDVLSMYTDYVWSVHWFLNALFVFFVQRLLPTFMDLRLDFAALIRRFAVVVLISNIFVNKHSDFLALGFLTGDDAICTLGLLFVTLSGVDSSAASRISLRFCWSSNLPACWYIVFDVVHTYVFKRRHGEWWLVNTNSLLMIFKTWWLQHTFNYNTLLFKCVNI